MSGGTAAYSIANGTLVEIRLKDALFRGDLNVQLHDSPSVNPNLDRIILEQPLELPSGKKHTGTVSFPVKDIRHIEVMELAGLFKKHNPEYEELPSLPLSIQPGSVSSKQGKCQGQGKGKKGKVTGEEKNYVPVEIQLKTYVIREPLQLKVLMKLIREIDLCGISLEGQNVGRNGIVAWIILTAGKTLIPLDIDNLYEQVPDLWKSLEKYIFSNEKIIKIIHDGRPAADYLWHVHRIKMVNVFDTQVADAYIYKEQMHYAPPQLRTLSDCLQMYNRRIPSEELDFLRKYENFDFSTRSPLLNKPLPPPEYLKLCAIKVKHLVPLRENMITKLMDRFSRCVEAHLSAYRDRGSEEYITHRQTPSIVPQKLLDILEEDYGQEEQLII